MVHWQAWHFDLVGGGIRGLFSNKLIENKDPLNLPTIMFCCSCFVCLGFYFVLFFNLHFLTIYGAVADYHKYVGTYHFILTHSKI